MDSQNAPLVKQASALRKQIDGHQERQQEIEVHHLAISASKPDIQSFLQLEIDEASIAQTEAAEVLKHYRNKLTDQETKVRRLTEKQALEEEEYAVSEVLCIFTLFMLWHRTGV
jgi:hypothetical protein